MQLKYVQKKDLHILHLNINSLLLKINEILFIAKKSNASVIGISGSELDQYILNSEVDIEGYDVIKMGLSRRGGRVTCYIRKSLSYNHKSVFYPTLRIFIDIFCLNQSQF